MDLPDLAVGLGILLQRVESVAVVGETVATPREWVESAVEVEEVSVDSQAETEV